MTVFPILSFVTGTGGLLVWYVGGRQAIAGEVTLGTLMRQRLPPRFVAYLGMFYGPLQFLNRVAEWLSRAGGRPSTSPPPSVSSRSWTASPTCVKPRTPSRCRGSKGAWHSAT